MTRDHVFDALVQRLIELGGDKATVAERARGMADGWGWFSDNSMDERGHLTCYDWMDSRVAWLLDQDERLRYGLLPEEDATWQSEIIRYVYKPPE